ncbi:unnamed protein product [Bursaphelenchus xylophilus]|uniref:(pine wood nematode) hypothetical protein n=1 Tax=Bursaphelenchus xylophilus TaxID=6326 RepID=A0A1I7RHQ1_BURXY|nr:unnamed protein product [Bursaphelenchus xylophilus]CAG9115503.1 unnamed protein product [Bursaphelenchus xylophilus]
MQRSLKCRLPENGAPAINMPNLRTVAIPSVSSPRSSSAEVDQPSSSQDAATGAMLFPPEDLTSYMMQNNNDLSAFFQHQQQAAAASSIAAAVAACSVQSNSSVAVTSSCAKSQAPPLSMPTGMLKPAGFNLAPINDVDMMKLLQNPNLLPKSLPSGLPPQPNDHNKPKPKEGNRPTVSPIPPQLMNGISSSPSHMVNGLKRPQPGTGLQTLQEQLVSSMNGPPPAKRHSISAMPTGPSLPQNGLMMSGPQMNPQLAAAVAAQQMNLSKMNMSQPGMMGMPGLNAQFMPNQRINGNDGPQPNLLNVPGPAQFNAMNMQQLQQLVLHQQLQQQLQQQAKNQNQAKLSGTAQHHQNIQQQHANWMQAKFMAEQQQRLAQQQQQQRMNGPSPIMNQMQLLQLMQQQNQQAQNNPLASNPAFLQQQQLMQLQQQQQILQLQQQQAQQHHTEQRRRAQTIGNASQLSALHNQIPSITLGQGIPQPLVQQLPTSLTPFSSLTPQPHQPAISPALSNNNNEQPQTSNILPNGNTPVVSSPSAPVDNALTNPPTLQPEQGMPNQEALQKMLASWSSIIDPQVLQQFQQLANAQTAVNQGNGQPQITMTSASEVMSEGSVASLLAPQSSSVDSAAPTTRAGSTNPNQPEDSEKSENGLVIAEEEDNPVVD